jgi:hypothetical protein
MQMHSFFSVSPRLCYKTSRRLDHVNLNNVVHYQGELYRTRLSRYLANQLVAQRLQACLERICIGSSPICTVRTWDSFTPGECNIHDIVFVMTTITVDIAGTEAKRSKRNRSLTYDRRSVYDAAIRKASSYKICGRKDLDLPSPFWSPQTP